MPLAGIEIARVGLGMGFEACLMPFPLRAHTEMPENLQPFVLVSSSNKRQHDIGLLLGSSDAVGDAVTLMCSQGAVLNDRLAKKVLFTPTSKVQVAVSDWTVQLQCDLTNPHHYCLAPVPTDWNQRGKNFAAPWDGVVHTTRKKWPTWKNRLLDHKIQWEGDAPERDALTSIEFDARGVPGWDTPAPNGHFLHAYQKEGVQFCLARGMRALIGDEMGVGKTAQAIAAAEAASAQRIVILCPASARYVWEREIKNWSARGEVQHIKSQFDKVDLNCRWHILTYDLLAVRPFSWTFSDGPETRAFLKVYPQMSDQIKDSKNGRQTHRKISFDEPLDVAPVLSDPARTQMWNEGMQSLRKRRDAGVLAQLLAMDQTTVVADEAHRAKNQEAKRTRALKQIAQRAPQLLLLTGTPLRNNEHEAAVLLSLLDDSAAKALSRERGYTIDDVKDCLNHLMIRRTKAEVLPELPEKTRQRIDLDDLDQVHLQHYKEALLNAKNAYDTALLQGASESEARQQMQGGIEQARTALGLAKVMSHAALETILQTVESKKCCVVFTSHHKVSDQLAEQLTRQKLTAAVIDGRVPPERRAAVVDRFQNGEIDVIIGGINAVGEAITLTRADTAIFVELDWVPAALLQAEDRIHRVGQKSSCQIIQLIARLPADQFNLDDMMVELLGSKLEVIGRVLDEQTTNVVASGTKSKLQERLLSRWRSTTTTDALSKSTELQPDAPPTAVTALQPVAVDQPVAKRKRGRPKKYSDTFPPPSATDRSKRSTNALIERGGKRVMLRLGGVANLALGKIMKLTGSQQATAVINQAIVELHRHLLKTSTKNPDPPWQ
jgi:superfamily II DNA or RNA helicase